MRDTPSFVSPGEQGVVLLGLCGADFDTASVICELLNKIGRVQRKRRHRYHSRVLVGKEFPVAS